MDTSSGVEGPRSVGGGNVWFKGADSERQAIRVDSRDTHGTYSVIESVARPGCAVPTHSHRDEDEHLLVISGRYRIAIGDQSSRCTARYSCDGPSEHAAQLAEYRRGGQPTAGDPHPGGIRADRLRGQRHSARKDPTPGCGVRLRRPRTTGRRMRGPAGRLGAHVRYPVASYPQKRCRSAFHPIRKLWRNSEGYCCDC